MKNRAAAIIIRNQNLLLIHRRRPGRDYYTLPGGGVEFDESNEEACMREVKEETGLDVLDIQPVLHFSNLGRHEFYFLTRVSEGEPVLGGNEAIHQSPENFYAFEWADAARLEQLNLLPE